MKTLCWRWLILLALFSLLPAFALDSADLLFHLSFDQGISAELARGSAQPTLSPPDAQQRLVEGLFGQGYRFAGKGSTLEYLSGEQAGARACAEMYGPKANLFGDAGTVAFWVKPLPNSHNMTHIFFQSLDPGGLRLLRNQYTHHQYHYAAKGGYVYDCEYTQNPWNFFALTWRKGEARAYFNGHPMSTLPETGVMTTPKRFQLACEGLSHFGFQTKEFQDDAVLDELQLFRRPLAPEEIRSLYERAHLTTMQQNGNIRNGTVTPPKRAYEGHALVAPRVTAPMAPDGKLADWQGIPAHGGFVERRVGVLDDDRGTVTVACDATNLYLGFACPVDDLLRNDPTHIWYPLGQFLANPLPRDGDLYGDDYVEYAIKSTDGHTYRFVINAKGSLLDSRDGDAGWNADIAWTSRSDFEDWTAELAIPLAAVGARPGDTVEFNVNRSWKLFKSAQSALCPNAQSQPGWGKLMLGGTASAGIESLGYPEKGMVHLRGRITGPAGNYTVKMHGQGWHEEFAVEKTVTVDGHATTFDLPHRLAKPGDMAVVVTVLTPDGETILTRTVPFVYVAASSVEIAQFPGKGHLDITVAPIGAENKGLRATVALLNGDQVVRQIDIPQFDDPAKTVGVDINDLAAGEYLLLTRILRGDELVGEDRQPYVKKPLPAWYGCNAGIIDTPPIPWTNVRVKGSTVSLLEKKVTFRKTLFPAQLTANGQSLLAAPIRLRVTRGGVEKVIDAGKFAFTNRTKRQAEWMASAVDGDLQITVKGRVEFDGFTWVETTFAGAQVERVVLEVPLRRECATLTTLGGSGLLEQPLVAPLIYSGYWFGNEQAGFSYFWESNQHWVLDRPKALNYNPPADRREEYDRCKVQILPVDDQVIISVPIIQLPTEFAEPRTIALGWTTTPTKPVRKDWRLLSLYKGVGYFAGDYTYRTPNYPTPLGNEAHYEKLARELEDPYAPLLGWYGFGTYMWVGSPEYADWWREWRFTPSELAKPDPNSTGWGSACANSSAVDLYNWRLERFVREYPQRGVYFDCQNAPGCDNAMHGCGYVDEQGERRPTQPLLALRRHYERVYNIIMAADPKYGFIRFHDWGPNMGLYAPFFTDNWIGEGMIGPIGATPEKNYYRVVNLPQARVQFGKEQWGHLTSWLTELACSAGNDKEKRAGWYGRMLTPPKDGKPGTWDLPRWKDYEHVAGLGLTHDMWQIGGNDLQLPWYWITQLRRLMAWDDKVRFLGYWELGNALTVEGGIPEQVVCSVYYRPPGSGKSAAPDVREETKFSPAGVWGRFTLDPAVKDALYARGNSKAGWLILTPMNNTDADVTLTLKPNLRQLGFSRLANGQAVDLFRAYTFVWDGPPGWFPNAGDPEPPHMTIPAAPYAAPVRDGAVTVTVPRRSFRMLLLEAPTQ
jgi:hypothetical protein